MSGEYSILPETKYDATKAHVHENNSVILVLCEMKLQHCPFSLMSKLDNNRFLSQMFLVEVTRVYLTDS